MKKYVIIGGAGFIGLHLAESLLALGNRVVIIDNFSTASSKAINPLIKTYRSDIEQAKEIEDIFIKEKPDFVYHLAGVINLRRSIKDPLFQNSLNVLGRTHSMLHACKKANVKKIIFISSGGAIYHNAKEVPTKESYLSHPSSLYGLANLAIEKYLEMFCKEYNMQYAILRLSNVFGPRQWESGIIPSFMASLLQRKRPVIYGDGKQTRDFIYIDDVTDALVLALKSQKNGIYNVGSGKEISLNQVFELMKSILGLKGLKPIYKKLEVQETKRSALDISKVKKEIHWKPTTDFKEGIIKTIHWFKEK